MTHGSKQFDILAPRSKFYRGPFGRIFPDLPAWAPKLDPDTTTEKYLKDVADTLMVELPGEESADIAEDTVKVKELERKFNSNIPAGYTYFGQFVDHDITFDPASSLMRQNDPSGLLNFRTPRLDLDSLYGAGPDNQPYLYDEDDRAKMATDTFTGTLKDGNELELPDLPRYGKQALIGDMRNDENAIVSQLHLAFLLAHNALVDRVRKVDGINPTTADKKDFAKVRPTFEAARRTLRWLYQHIVWNDFIQRIVDGDIHKCALKKAKGCGRTVWVTGLEDVYRWQNQPFMPVEFSVAAYRFGHSMVRNSYQTNAPASGAGTLVPLFNNSGNSNPDDLRGFRPMTAANSIQWDWFLQMKTSNEERGFPQMARKIDTKLSNALSFLPKEVAGDEGNVLALRNLQRSMSFGLPSGTSVARKLGLELSTLDVERNGTPAEPDALWYYILKEAENGGGNTLGPVGSTIVAAVFAGLLKGDPNSYFTMEPNWTPNNDRYLKGTGHNVEGKKRKWTLASIIRIAGLKANGIGFEGDGTSDANGAPPDNFYSSRQDHLPRGPGGQPL